MGRKTEMPDDKMKNQQAGQKDQGQGQHSPGRNPQDDQSTGRRSGGGSTNKEPMHDDEGRGGSQGGQKGSQGQGGMGQKR
jgi:hypothetical protein